MKPIEICILAAGMGSRMKSDKPKVLHSIAGQPLLAHLLSTAAKLGPKKIHVVIGKGAEQVKATFPEADVNWALQKEQKGTGHAVMQAMPAISDESRVIILYGDAPLIEIATLQNLISTECELGVLTVDLVDPFNYGRILRDQKSEDSIARIVEEKDATDDERKICEINSGVMVADAGHLNSWLAKLDTDNEQGEFLLTDIVELANRDNCRVKAIKVEDETEVSGINTFEQLAKLERLYQAKQALKLMNHGVHIVDPARIDLRGQLTTGNNVVIDINCIFEGSVSLGNNVRIESNCVIKNSTIDSGSVIKPNTTIEDSQIGEDCSVGPFARIRPGTHMIKNVSVGNFVEVKKSTLDVGTKAGHLSYLGDSTIGKDVNIGAGTITCNYDGVNKFQTVISDDVFVGSNSSLVAPVTIGAGATIGAGSTITRAVEKGLAIGRGKQKDFKSWKGPRDK